MNSYILLKINYISTISQDISGKIVDISNNLTIKVYCIFWALSDLDYFQQLAQHVIHLLKNPYVFQPDLFFKKQAIIVPQNPKIFF